MVVLKKLRNQAASGRALLVILALGLTARPLRAQAGSEYEVKAAFLYKFASFVEWPHNLAAGPISICIAGQDPFGQTLDRVVHDKFINGRRFTVRRVKRNEPMRECQILFVGASERSRL